MSRAHLTIAYDGPALRDGVMDVRDLAPALLAVGQLFDAANTALNGQDAEIKVQVRATGAACFTIDLQVVQTLLHAVTHFLAGEDVTAAANLVTLVFGTGIGAGVFALIKLLRGGKPKSVEPIQPGFVRVTDENGQSLDVPLAALRLYSDISVRVAIEQVVVAPLSKDGIDRFDVRDESGAEVASVEKADAASFARPELPDEPIVEETRRAAYSIISLAFKEDNKWRLSDGSSQISARIDDRGFLDRVEANQVAFSKGDILICDVRTTATQTATGLKTDYVVERVVDHRPALRQLRLFDDPPQGPHRDTA